MSETRNRNYIEYPMDFSNPNGEKMRPILDSIGLTSDTVNKQQKSKRLRSTLIARGLLFTMMRPTHTERSPAHAYLHPAYTQAAFQGRPDLRDCSRGDLWLKEATQHLQAFALQDEARHIVGMGIASHFDRIASKALKLPHSKNDIWIPAYETADGIDPMGIMGVTARKVALSPHPHQDIYKDNSDRGRTYYRITSIMSHIGWTVPGIETEETRTNILDALSTTLDPEKAVNPQTLFMAGTATVMGTEIPLTEIFDLQDQ